MCFKCGWNVWSFREEKKDKVDEENKKTRDQDVGDTDGMCLQLRVIIQHSFVEEQSRIVCDLSQLSRSWPFLIKLSGTSSLIQTEGHQQGQSGRAVTDVTYLSRGSPPVTFLLPSNYLTGSYLI